MNQVTGLSLGRVAVGAVALSRPELLGRLLGVEPAANAQLTYLVRLFGAREVALGLVTLGSRDSSRRNAVLAGIAVDLADAGTGMLGMRDDDVPRMQGGVLVATASGAAVTGLSGLWTARRDSRSAAKAAARAQDAVAEAARVSGRAARRSARRAVRRAEKLAA